jgi:NAD(P)-dependent dehydrogenase (short-subunit alcohol dehydrogenase family)
MIDINAEVENQAKRLTDEGGTAKGYILDITNRDAVLACFEQIEKDLGPVFALVNNAGIVDQRPFEEITAEQINKQMAVNVNGTLFCSQGAVKGMKANKQGRIINFSSKSGKTGSALMAHYSAAKGAIIALTHALAFELADDNIQVNCICPGITDASGVWAEVSRGYTENLKLPKEEVVKKFTAKIPLKRLTNIEDVVEMVYFLTLKGDYMTGQAYNITGGREMH